VLAVASEPSVWAFSGYDVPVDVDRSVSHHVLHGRHVPVLIVNAEGSEGGTGPVRVPGAS
jgi:hypothetical protein